MKRTLSLLLFTTLSASTLATNFDEVLRANKNVKFLVQVSTAGASTPSTIFNKAKNPAEEPKMNNFLTPLGQR
jgi:hypothetical protein